MERGAEWTVTGGKGGVGKERATGRPAAAQQWRKSSSLLSLSLPSLFFPLFSGWLGKDLGLEIHQSINEINEGE